MLINKQLQTLQGHCAPKMAVPGYLSTWHDISEALNFLNLFFQSYDKTTSADDKLKV